MEWATERREAVSAAFRSALRRPPRFGMADHDEMTGATAWDDWAARQWDAKIAAVLRNARPGEVFGPITPPPGGGPARPEPSMLAQIVKRTGPEPSFAGLFARPCRSSRMLA